MLERKSLELNSRQWEWLETQASDTEALSRRGPTAGESSWRVFLSNWINEGLKKMTEITIKIDRWGTQDWLTDEDGNEPSDEIMNAYIAELQHRIQLQYDDSTVVAEYENDLHSPQFHFHGLLGNLDEEYEFRRETEEVFADVSDSLGNDWSWYDRIVNS